MAGKLRIECKTTSKMVYSLALDDLRKIRLEALRGRAEDWAFQVEFQRTAGLSKKLAVVERSWFLQAGGTVKEPCPILAEDKTVRISPPLCAFGPRSIVWTVVSPKMTATYSFVFCQWEDFMALYQKTQGAPS